VCSSALGKWHKKCSACPTENSMYPCQRRKWQCGKTHSTCCDTVQTGTILWWGATHSCVIMRRHIIALQSISVVLRKFPVQIQHWRWFYCVELLWFSLLCSGKLDMRHTGSTPPAATSLSIYYALRLSWQCKLLKKFVYKDHNETTHYYMTCDQFCRPYARQHVQQAEILIQTKFTVNTSSLRAACRCCNVQVTALLMFIIHRTSDRCCDAVGQFSYANC